MDRKKYQRKYQKRYYKAHKEEINLKRRERYADRRWQGLNREKEVMLGFTEADKEFSSYRGTIMENKYPCHCYHCKREIKPGEPILWNAKNKTVLCKQCTPRDLLKEHGIEV